MSNVLKLINKDQLVGMHEFPFLDVFRGGSDHVLEVNAAQGGEFGFVCLKDRDYDVQECKRTVPVTLGVGFFGQSCRALPA